MIALSLLLILNASADVYDFPKKVTLGQSQLSLNGVGTRTATLFAFKIYDAAFYTSESVQKADAALSAPGPKRLDIRYRRDVSLEDTVDAWKFQFRESSGLPLEELKTEMDALLSYQSEIKNGDLHRFDLTEEGTRFWINDQLKGTIPGPRFQKAFLTIFFGKNPPTYELQKNLLKGWQTHEEKLTSR